MKSTARLAALLIATLSLNATEANAAGHTFGLPFRLGSKPALAASVAALQVYSGCAQPPATQAGLNYYVGPTGSDAANGLTPGTRWQTFAHAIATVSSNGGDTINLYTGTYTDQTISGNMTAFDVIKPVSGQVPVFKGMTNINGASKWVLSGLTFQDTYAAVHFGGAGDPLIEANGTDTNIVLDSNDFSSASSGTATGWNAAAWAANARGIGIDIDDGSSSSPAITCVTLTNNTFHYLGIGIQNVSNNSLMKGNAFNWYDGDGVDFSGSNLEISFNTFTNSLNPSGGGSSHPDAIQGQVGRCVNAPLTCTFSNILVNANSAIELTSSAASVPFTSANTLAPQQGISAFDEDWSNVTVTNNIVVNTSTSGIAWDSCHTCDFANNTSLDQAQSTNFGIAIYLSHQSDAGSPDHVHIWNNITNGVDEGTANYSNFTVDHNLLTKYYHGWFITGSEQNVSAAGTYGTANVITSTALNNAIVTTFDTSTPSYNLHLKVGSPAIAAGTLPAPAFSSGTARAASPDEGAY